MTTRERREYSSSNVVRTLHPSRPLSPGQQAKVDHNLDYLLDDLQNSVERTKSNKDYLSPSNHNTSTVVRERSVSPGGGESRRVYKTAHYEYSTSTGGGGGAAPPSLRQPALDVQQNINSLDSLLLDLKHERERSLDRVENTYSNVGIDDGLLVQTSQSISRHITPPHSEPSSHVTKTTKTYTNVGNIGGGGGQQPRPSTTTTVNRELLFDSPLSTSTKTTTVRQSRSRQRSPVGGYDNSSHVTRDVSYDSDPTVDNPPASNTTTINRSYNNTYNSSRSGAVSPQRHQQPHQVVPYNEFVEEVDASTLPAELSGLPLAGGILPGPGTKVTTTIKTFTYEIPGEATVPTNQSFHYKNDTYNTNTTNTQHLYPAPERDVPSPHPVGGGNSTTIYKNETYNTINRSTGPAYPPVSHDVPPPVRRSVSPVDYPGTVNKSVIIKRETHNTTSNVYPPSPQLPHHPQPQQPHHPTNNTTYVYKQDIRNTNTNTVVHPDGGVPPHTTVVYEPAAPQPGPKQTYLYKREVTNTKNTVYGPPGGPGGPPNGRAGSPQPLVEYPNGPQPAGPTHIMYNYSTTTNTTNTRNVHGHPDDNGSRQPLLPFPVDGHQQPPSQVDGNPPKRLDDLLATFGDTNGHGPNHRGGIEEPYTPRKEINTALTTGKAEPLVEQKATMKPIAGPPVYYPQGNKEMFAKAEQSEAAWRAQGGYAKASGNYEYEAASKSKSSSKSGAAVVPVCLPLCCAMPCSIM